MMQVRHVIAAQGEKAGGYGPGPFQYGLRSAHFFSDRAIMGEKWGMPLDVAFFIIARYREAIICQLAAADESARGDQEDIAQECCAQWADFYGQDSLREMSFGHPDYLDKKILAFCWQSNERDLKEIAAMPEAYGGPREIERIKAEQSVIERLLGPDCPTVAHWKGFRAAGMTPVERDDRARAWWDERRKKLAQPRMGGITMTEALESNPEAFVSRYRDAIARLEGAPRDERIRAEWLNVAKRLRARWKDWQGEDSLHEMAFGEPEE
jgi:hypothetical protein